MERFGKNSRSSTVSGYEGKTRLQPWDSTVSSMVGEESFVGGQARPEGDREDSTLGEASTGTTPKVKQRRQGKTSKYIGR